MSEVGIICFAGSYAVVLILEITRLWFRSGLRGLSIIGVALAGLVAHSAYLYYGSTKGGVPLSSEQDWYLLVAWVLAVTYLYLICFHPRSNFGVFLLPIILGLIGVGAAFAQPTTAAVRSASKVWGLVHGVGLSLGAVMILLGFMAGLMYLYQSWLLKRNRTPIRGLKLPTLEWLRLVGVRTLFIATILFGIGVFSGAILNQIQSRRGPGAIPWYDPTLIATTLMFFWLVVATIFSLLHRRARRGHTVAWLTVINFGLLIVVMAISLLSASSHRHDRGEKEAAPVALAPCQCSLGIVACMPHYPSADVRSSILQHSTCQPSSMELPHQREVIPYRTPKNVLLARNMQASHRKSTGRMPVAPSTCKVNQLKEDLRA